MCIMLFWFLSIIRCFCFPSYYIPFFLSYLFHSYFLSSFQPLFLAFKFFVHSFYLCLGPASASIPLCLSPSVSLLTFLSLFASLYLFFQFCLFISSPLFFHFVFFSPLSMTQMERMDALWSCIRSGGKLNFFKTISSGWSDEWVAHDGNDKIWYIW